MMNTENEMTTKPEALRLADALDRQYLHACKPAAAELRRLHAENDLLRSAVDNLRVALRDECRDEVHRLVALYAQRDALLAVVNKLEYSSDGCIKRYPEESEVNAAIEAV